MFIIDENIIHTSVDLIPGLDFYEEATFSPKDTDFTADINGIRYLIRENDKDENAFIFYPPCTSEIANLMLTMFYRNKLGQKDTFFKVMCLRETYIGTYTTRFIKNILNAFSLQHYFKPEISIGIFHGSDLDLRSRNKTNELLLFFTNGNNLA